MHCIDGTATGKMIRATITCLFSLGVLTAANTGALAQRQEPAPDVRKNVRDDAATPSIFKQEKNFPLDANWVLSAMNDKVLSGDRPFFVLDQNYRAKGFAGCNTFSAVAYPQRQQKFAVGFIAVTKKACEKPIMDLERQFLVLLRTTQEWDIVDGRLIFKGPSGSLRFDRGL